MTAEAGRQKWALTSVLGAGREWASASVLAGAPGDDGR
jgi:hypothetical protein